MLQDAKESVEQANNEKEVDEAVEKYNEILNTHFYMPFGAASMTPIKVEENDSSLSASEMQCKENATT